MVAVLVPLGILIAGALIVGYVKRKEIANIVSRKRPYHKTRIMMEDDLDYFDNDLNIFSVLPLPPPVFSEDSSSSSSPSDSFDSLNSSSTSSSSSS